MLQPNLVLVPLEHGGVKLGVGGDVADGLGRGEFVGLLCWRYGELIAASSLATAGSGRRSGIQRSKHDREDNTTRGSSLFYCPQKKDWRQRVWKNKNRHKAALLA
jgi:hypothetical protein